MNSVNTDIETNFVFNSYDAIADDFDKTRSYSWTGVYNFLKNLPRNSLVLDAGCGNGRNMILNDDIIMEGFDTCDKFVNICKTKQLNVFKADVRMIPKNDNYYDYCICIAVIGHIYEQCGRIIAINELLRVTKPNGLVFIQFWDINAVYQNKIPNKFVQCRNQYVNNELMIYNDHDYIVTWGDDKIKRYYHLFDMNEIKELLSNVNCSIVDIYREKAGIIAIIQRNTSI